MQTVKVQSDEEKGRRKLSGNGMEPYNALECRYDMVYVVGLTGLL